MSTELNKESIIKTLDNGIGVFEREKINLKDNLKDLNEYLSDYFVNLPSQTNELRSVILKNEQKINENFAIIIGLLKNIKNRISTIISNIFINIDLQHFRNMLSNSFQSTNEIIFSIGKIKSDIDDYKISNPEIKPMNTLLTMPIHFDKTYSQTVSILENILTNTSITIQYLTNIVDNLKEIERKVSDYSNIDYKKRFEEDTNLLLKQFENQISNLVNTYENQVKRFNLDIKASTDAVSIYKENLENIELKSSELNNKLSDYDRKLQEIANNRYADIQVVLENKLLQLETITNEKITVIDQSYQNAQTNYEKFKDLVEKAGIYNLIVNYKEKAQEENDEYKRFRKYTNRAIYWAIGTAFVMFLISWGEIALTGKDTNLFFFIYRMSISLMFFVLAFYSSKQASKHYECFQDNNRTYLQLAALEPFMEKMSEDEKKEIRKNLVPIYFSQSSEGKYSSKGDEVTLPADLKGFAEKLIDVGKGLLDKAKDEPKPNP